MRLLMALFCVVSMAFSLAVSAGERNDSVCTICRDSVCVKTSFANTLDRFSSSRLYRMTYIGVPLIVGGALVKSEDDHFRSLRNDYLPQFNRHLDDYLQFSPAVVMLGMKSFGVESRSSWGRMITSDAFSALLMGGVVNTLKHSTNVVRPDGSNNHSFPSGHTATAFMAATMLTKEYGHKSALVGIGAYSVASATGLMRMANNKHWLSDVLTGAGIGILSTELGYYFADLLFKDKGINRFDDCESFNRLDKPSFVGLYIGFNVPLSKYDIDEQTVFRTSSGCSAGVEGAYYFNPFIGVGGRFVASNSFIIVNGNSAEDNTYKSTSMCGGAYFSYPISSRLLIGYKLLGGYVYYPQLKLSELTVLSRNGACFGSGTSLTFRTRGHCGVRLFLDYNVMSAHSYHSKEWMNILTGGAAIDVMF